MRSRFLFVLPLLACAAPRAPATAASNPVLLATARDERIAALLRDVDARRIRAYDSTLVAFGTRNTYSDTLSTTRGIGAARRWIHAQLTGFSAACNGCLRVEFDTGTMQTPRNQTSPSRLITNVLAWLPGRDTTHVVVIGGHFDSCVCALPNGGRDSVSDAPGANDDGSGSSAVMELARVFSRAFPRGLRATVIFALYDGEEQGLLGSTHLARRLKASGYDVIAGMTNDIVGNVTAEDGTTDSSSVRIFAADPDTSRSRELARHVLDLGDAYLRDFRVVPVWRLDRVGRGGDHRPYVELGWAGLRFTEHIEDEKRQHRPEDDFAHVNFAYVANVARIDAATVASLGLAPMRPDSARAARDVATTGGRRWTLTWTPVPDAVGYEILLRSTTSPRYERALPVGNATTYALDVQLDDVWAGIRAVGADGQRSLPIVVPRVAAQAPASGGRRPSEPPGR